MNTFTGKIQVKPPQTVFHSIAYYRFKEYVQSYAMILPQLIGFFIFSVYPIAWILRFAWFDYDNVHIKYIGFENFIRAFTRDPEYWNDLLNTFILAFGKLSVELPLALVIAVLLNANIKGRSFFRAVFYMPNVISVAIIGLIFYFMFATFDGAVNNVLMGFHLIKQPVNWFGYKWTALLIIAFASIWQNFGINMLFFLSGLQNIPNELYECADIDGANGIQKFFHITIPMLSPIMQIVFMLAMLGSVKMTELVLVLTNGQPAGQSEVVMTYIFKYFFNVGEGSSVQQVGYASSLGFITAIILGLMTLLYLRLSKKMSAVY